MDTPTLLEKGIWFHGHKCPAMPMGLRVSLAAMDALCVDQRARAGELITLVESDSDHCATCFADGVQVVTGCNFGKGNIQKLHYGKWGLTLIDRKQNKAVRVVPRTEVMAEIKKTEFIAKRKARVPPTMIPEEISQPLVDRVMNMHGEQLYKISEVFDYTWEAAPHTFESVICEECGEMVVERNARVQNGRVLCIPCAGLK
jgi:formylmethanofuran dehydrogenase subunit E